ncbi:hypothetical protein V8G54_006592, partial [Vigna mungo]
MLAIRKNFEKVINILQGCCFIKGNGDCVPINNPQIYFIFVSNISNFLSIGGLNFHSVKEGMVLNFHGTKFLQSQGKDPSKAMNSLGNCFKSFRSMIHSIHSSHVCKQCLN